MSTTPSPEVPPTAPPPVAPPPLDAAILPFLAACALGAIAGAMDWLAVASEYPDSLTALGFLVLVASHVALFFVLAAKGLRPRRWIAALVAAVICGVVVGGPIAFFLAFGSSPLFHGHWSFG